LLLAWQWRAMLTVMLSLISDYFCEFSPAKADSLVRVCVGLDWGTGPASTNHKGTHVHAPAVSTTVQVENETVECAPYI
jgi:hypothetical protein